MMLWAVAATAMVSCANDLNDGASVNVNGESNLVNITLSAEKPATVRTEMEGTTPYWSVGDKIGVYTAQEKDADNYYLTNDATERALKTSFTGGITLSNTLYVYYPYTTNGIAAAGVKHIIPTVQEPTATSFDGKADIMIAKPVTLDAEGKQLSDLEFARLGAIVKVVLKDNTSTLAGQHVSSLTMTTANDIAGRVYLDVVNQVIGELYDDTPSKSVTANYTEATQYEIDNANATYFIVYPQTLAENSGISFTATTEEYTITKNITEHVEYALESGKITTFTVNLAAEHITKNETVEWVNNAYNLVPSTNYLEVGDKVVIVATNADKAMGAYGGGNNCPAVAVVKNENNTVEIDNSVNVLTVESGNVDGTFAFKTTGGYLYAASSSSNHLKVEATLSNNSSWTVNIADGIATVKAKGSNTRNWMRYNSSSNLFSCYTSEQTDISIYKLVGEYTIKDPAIVITANTTTIAYDATSGSAPISTTYGEGWTLTATSSETWISNLAYDATNSAFTFDAEANEGDEREATITITATREGYDDVTKEFTIKQTAKPAEGETVTKGEAWSYTFTAKQWSANGAKTLNGLSWTLAGDGNYWGYDSTKGQQLGSKNAPYRTMSVSTSDYVGGVNKVVVNTSGASGISAKVSVTIGGKQIGTAQTISTSATDYTFESTELLTGEIVITYTITTAKGLYIKKLAIN